MADLSLTLTADGINTVLHKLVARSTQNFPSGNWLNIGPLRLKFDGATGHAEAQSNTFSIIDPALGGARGHLSELDWVWDRLAVAVGLDIPTVTIGGWCILPTPFGCALRVPRVTFFGADPDIEVSLNLAGLRHEVSASFGIDVRKDTTAYGLYLQPEMPIDVDVLDIADMAGDLLDKLVNLIVNKLLSWLPSWARDIVSAILGGIARLVRNILDLADDLTEWISRKIGVSLGLFNQLASAILALFFKPVPIFSVDNPYQVLAPGDGLPAVGVPVQAVAVAFDKPAQALAITLSL